MSIVQLSLTPKPFVKYNKQRQRVGVLTTACRTRVCKLPLSSSIYTGTWVYMAALNSRHSYRYFKGPVHFEVPVSSKHSNRGQQKAMYTWNRSKSIYQTQPTEINTTFPGNWSQHKLNTSIRSNITTKQIEINTNFTIRAKLRNHKKQARANCALNNVDTQIALWKSML